MKHERMWLRKKDIIKFVTNAGRACPRRQGSCSTSTAVLLPEDMREEKGSHAASGDAGMVWMGRYTR